MRYDEFNQECCAMLLKTAFLSRFCDGWNLVQSIRHHVVIDDHAGGFMDFTPDELAFALFRGYLGIRPPGYLHESMQLRAIPPGWETKIVSDRKSGAVWIDTDALLMDKVGGKTLLGRDTSPDPIEIWKALTETWDIILAEIGTVTPEELGKVEHVALSVPSAPKTDQQRTVRAWKGNPWVGSDFVNFNLFEIDPSKMYLEIERADGQIRRNGQVVKEGTYQKPSGRFQDTFEATMTVEGREFVGTFTRAGAK